LDKDIITLLQTYQKEFLQAASVYDFIIQDQKAIDKLKQIHQVINIAQAIILSGTKTGFNHDINPYRKALGKEV
jgi:acyl-[acyl carrier protein]--UDP-N-acetylglucosamine O-acyltransferase